MTKEEFYEAYKNATNFDSFPATPETMNFAEFASGEYFKYEDSDNLYVKVKLNDTDFRVVALNKETEEVTYL